MNTIFKFLLVGFLVLFAVGCRETNVTTYMPGPGSMQSNVNTSASSGRFSIVQVDIFKDDLAYDDKRAIYILTDRKTGKEYVGISGIGIAELGDHPAGKAKVADER